MASLVTRQQSHYDVLAEGVTADGRIVRRVEARADDLADVAEAFRLAAVEARRAHLPVALVRLSASRNGAVEVAMVDEAASVDTRTPIADPLTQSALLDGQTKVDSPPPSPPPGPMLRHQALSMPVGIGRADCPVCEQRWLTCPHSYHRMTPLQKEEWHRRVGRGVLGAAMFP